MIDGFIDSELERLELPDSRLAIAGFSQGAMMALHVGLRRRRAPAAILAYSGVLVGPEHLHEATARDDDGATPPILLIHGSRDEVVPPHSLFTSAQQLAEANIPCQWHLALGLGHGIDHEGIRQGACFLARSLGMPTPDLARR